MRISDWSSDVCSSDLHVGFDGIGYQTGICESDDLINWRRLGVIMARDPDDPITRYNIACASILRENGLQSPARLFKLGGRYVAAWPACPNRIRRESCGGGG